MRGQIFLKPSWLPCLGMCRIYLWSLGKVLSAGEGGPRSSFCLTAPASSSLDSSSLVSTFFPFFFFTVRLLPPTSLDFYLQLYADLHNLPTTFAFYTVSSAHNMGGSPLFNERHRVCNTIVDNSKWRINSGTDPPQRTIRPTGSPECSHLDEHGNRGSHLYHVCAHKCRRCDGVCDILRFLLRSRSVVIEKYLPCPAVSSIPRSFVTFCSGTGGICTRYI